MLTASEREWLYSREDVWRLYGLYTCLWCTGHCTLRHDGLPCRLDDTDWQDALEFSERVAARLAGRVDACLYVTMPMSKHCMLTGCVACKLRDARLAVEEEMDGENS